MKSRQLATRGRATTSNGKHITKNSDRRIAFAYARARGRYAVIHDRAPRASAGTRIGIVSHPNYRDPSKWSAIRSQMEWVLAEHGGRGAEAVTLLAAPTDRLFALIACQQGMRLSLVIPCKNFESCFTTYDDLSEYLYLRTSAHSQTVFDHPTFTREAFEGAAKLIVDTCDVLVAIGSGQSPQDAMGSIVQYAHEKGKLLLWIDPDAPNLARRISFAR
jgi:hypothetical protein